MLKFILPKDKRNEPNGSYKKINENAALPSLNSNSDTKKSDIRSLVYGSRYSMQQVINE